MGALRNIYDIIKTVITRSVELNLGLIAAGVAFFTMFSLFPGLAALIAIWGLFADPVVVLEQTNTLQGVVPEDAFQLLYQQVSNIVNARSETLGFASAISLAVALWSSRAGVGALTQGLNTICGVKDRPGLRHYLASMGLTLLLMGVAVVTMTSVVIAPILLAFIPTGLITGLIIDLTRWALAMAVVLSGLGAVYHFGPNLRGRRVGWFSQGSMIVAVLWFIASAAFSIYLSRFGNYNEIYGSIGAVIALMMWFYISAYLVLFGAAWNMAIREKRAKARAQTPPSA